MVHQDDGDDDDANDDGEDNHHPLPASVIEVVAQVREITVF